MERHVELFERDPRQLLHDLVEDVLAVADDLAVLQHFKRRIACLGGDHDLTTLLDVGEQVGMGGGGVQWQ
ncbi:hypothetical protein D3C78_1286190 [compost metagenome]